MFLVDGEESELCNYANRNNAQKESLAGRGSKHVHNIMTEPGQLMTPKGNTSL